MVLRCPSSQTPPFLFHLFANMYLQGTMIFCGGCGAAVIPLPCEYVVAEGAPPFLAGSAAAFLGIFMPGIVLVRGTMGVSGGLRSRRWVKSGVRGLNAGAVGLAYTAVYRI
ncbi:hypothetical protein PG997_014531 [Apiospora hydei]|uniref:Uncharacterized protein n=1 Tax=Apiospora hydei TaxID=1337664 RepID=A0ABR1UX74_9PEZI